MKVNDIVALIGAVVLAVGIALFLWPISAATSTYSSVDCGSALSMDTVSIQGAHIAWGLGPNERGPYPGMTNCQDALGDQRLLAWIVAGIGAAALAGGLLARPKGEPAEPTGLVTGPLPRPTADDQVW